MGKRSELNAKIVKRENVFYNFGVGICAVLIWSMLYQAQFREYDDNYGLLIEAFFLSVLATTAILRLKPNK